MTTSGTVTDYNIRSLSGDGNLILNSLTAGPDGNLWFSGYSGNFIYAGSFNISTGAATLHPAGVLGYSPPGPIVAGSDGNLWYYAENGNNSDYVLLRVDPSSGVTTSTFTSDSYSIYSGLTAGPDGGLWTTDVYYKTLISFTVPGGTLSKTYNLPASVTSVGDLTSGPDGNLWFIDGGKYDKVTTSGSFTGYTPPSGVSVGQLVAGFDDAVWFIDNSSTKKIGRIASSGDISEYTVPDSTIGSLTSLVLGPDNAMWFSYSDSGVTKLGRLVVAPDFTSYPISSTYSGPQRPVVAGDSLWYLEYKGGVPAYIGNMTTSGVTTDYDMRSLSGNANLVVVSIATGSDGNIWFSSYSGNFVYTGSLNISTGIVTLHPSGILSYGYVGPIVAGSDGNLWYYVKNANNNEFVLLRVDPSSGAATSTFTSDTYSNYSNLVGSSDGKLWTADVYYKSLTSFVVPGGTLGSTRSFPAPLTSVGDMVSGPDNNMWFVGGGEFYKMTSGGTFTSYAPASGVSPGRLAAGIDGAVWFTDTASTKKIGYITSTGDITEYIVPGSGIVSLTYLTLGPDDAMWFTYTDSGGAKLGRLSY
jgi:virginiamycin B lyase